MWHALRLIIVTLICLATASYTLGLAIDGLQTDRLLNNLGPPLSRHTSPWLFWAHVAVYCGFAAIAIVAWSRAVVIS